MGLSVCLLIPLKSRLKLNSEEKKEKERKEQRKIVE